MDALGLYRNGLLRVQLYTKYFRNYKVEENLLKYAFTKCKVGTTKVHKNVYLGAPDDTPCQHKCVGTIIVQHFVLFQVYLFDYIEKVYVKGVSSNILLSVNF